MMTSRTLVWSALLGCSSAPPPAPRPEPAPQAPADAAIAVAPDANLAEAVATAPAWVFRYSTPQRSETWTLRYRDGAAMIVVEAAQGTTRYLGSATEGASLALSVSTPTAKLALDCKRTKRALSTKCNDAKAKPIEVLDCYHPDFKEPMPFGPAPGVEYVATAGCNGYRLVTP